MSCSMASEVTIYCFFGGTSLLSGLITIMDGAFVSGGATTGAGSGCTMGFGGSTTGGITEGGL